MKTSGTGRGARTLGSGSRRYNSTPVDADARAAPPVPDPLDPTIHARAFAELRALVDRYGAPRILDAVKQLTVTTKTVPGAPPRKGLCPIRPALDGSQGNPMRFCTKKKNHPGRHSWQSPTDAR